MANISSINPSFDRLCGSKQIDKLGVLLAQISELTKEAESIKSALKASGNSEFDGKLFHAVVINQIRTSVDWETIAEKLNPSRQLVAAYTSSKEVVMVKVNARQQAKAA